MHYCRTNGYEHILDSRHFYEFWILLHQRAPLELQQLSSEAQEAEGLLGGVMEAFGRRARRLTVQEREQVLKVTDRYSIKDMELVLEVDNNVI